MAGAFLGAATGGILKKVISLASNEMSLAWGFKAELKRLSKRFETAQSLLTDAENRKLVKSETVQNWLKKLKLVACDAEDVLEEIAFEALRRDLEIQNRFRKKVRNSFSLAFRLKMAHKIKNINSTLDEIYKEATDDLGLRPVDLVSTSVEPREIRQTHPFVDDSKIVGRDHDVSRVVEMLLVSDNDKDLPVAALVGLGGLGKTTLAQLVYKNEEVVKNFGTERMWVCVSDDFKVERLLDEMVQSLTGRKSGISNIEGLIKLIGKKLNGKSYLLVLDDVWNENRDQWEKMRNSLLGINGGRGSKILVTTRSEAVVSTLEASLTHRLEKLSDEDSWTMFQKRAFAYGGPMETPNLVEVGRSLVKKCVGVPLAIKALGGLMYSKKNERDWLSIQRDDIWNSPENNNDMLLPSLMLSFEHLPSPSLKQCFAHCSIFPKDHDIEKDEIILIWMAQGYLQPPEGSNWLMEDVGNYYFNVLVWNSLLQDVTDDEDGDLTYYKMHDLVHDLALHVSKNNVLTINANELRDVSDQVLHLSVLAEEEEVVNIPKEIVGRMRTVRFSNDILCDMRMLDAFKRVRELTLSGCDDLPESIGKLRHLRYLNVCDTRIQRLPDSICQLYSLQTLIVLGCFSLEGLPKEFRKLVSLRHFYADDTEALKISMPMGIGQLTHLQTILFFVVGVDDGHRIEELGPLSNLRGQLKIYQLEHVRNGSEAQKAELSRKPKICELELLWSWRRLEEEVNNDKDVLDGLQPPKSLEKLTISDFRGENFASWMTMASPVMSVLCCLVEIRLLNCNRCKQVPTLGHLPHLQVVYIEWMDSVECIGAEFYGDISSTYDVVVFPSLRELTLKYMGNLVEWLEPESASFFPRLEALFIDGCDKLIKTPGYFPSLRILCLKKKGNLVEWLEPEATVFFPRLKELFIYGCDKLFNSPDYFPSLRGLSQKKKGNLVEWLEPESTSRLEELFVDGCDKLIKALGKLGNFPSLKKVEIYDLKSSLALEKMSRTLSSLESLRIGSVSGSELNLVLEQMLVNNRSLTTMEITYCKELSYLPNVLQNHASLVKIKLQNCPNLRCPPNGLYLPVSIEDLYIVDCPNLVVANPHELVSLQELTIGGYSEWPFAAAEKKEEDISQKFHFQRLRLYGSGKVKYLPEQLRYLTTALMELTLWDFQELEYLPEWLGDLSSLRSIAIHSAYKLMKLPTKEAIQRLTNLQSLRISGCPLLEEICKKGSGPEWDKIAHIPSISIHTIYGRQEQLNSKLM